MRLFIEARGGKSEQRSSWKGFRYGQTTQCICCIKIWCLECWDKAGTAQEVIGGEGRLMKFISCSRLTNRSPATASTNERISPHRNAVQIDRSFRADRGHTAHPLPISKLLCSVPDNLKRIYPFRFTPSHIYPTPCPLSKSLLNLPLIFPFHSLLCLSLLCLSFQLLSLPLNVRITGPK